jgi:hypothetical protein
MLRGEPRRIWRGRIIELLRNEHAPLLVAELIDRMIPAGLFEGTLLRERQELVAIVAMLLDEGMIERRGVVREGGLEESDVVSLPE